MAAIAIPMISNINEKAKTAKNKRNAQNIASVYGAATAAGATITATTAAAVVTALSTGVNGADQFADTKFQVSISTAEDKTAAAALLNDPVGGVLTTKF
jgi:type IV pilus assembly protein PilA